MDPITGISLILSLIPFWQREHDKGKMATKEDFYAWLVFHKFESVKEYIENNSVLLVEIEDLLKLNQSELLRRFDIVDKRLMRVLSGLGEFREFVTRLFPQEVLSQNEKNILTQFVESGESDLFLQVTNSRSILQFGVTPAEEYDSRFVVSSLQNLAEAGYIQLIKSEPTCYHYLLTESGYEYIQLLKGENQLSPQAENILLQYYQTGEPYLLTCLDECGKVDCVQANNVELSFSEPNYIHDDLDSLCECGLIKFDGDLGGGGRRYIRTRKGEEYVNTLRKRIHADA